MPTAPDQLRSLLKEHFGHSTFRPNQEAVCRAATAGRDCLLVMPTGAGKSLCYQLPALARQAASQFAGQHSPALVISPLIALMDDQAAKLTAAGLRVARIHSGLAREDARQACRDYLDGSLNFLFVAPERMRVPGFPEMLARRKPSLIAIDEAHCISAWGHDFRPDYRALGTYLPALRPAPILALTATATPEVQRDIALQLALQDPALFIHGFRRSNLAIEVLELSKPQRFDFIANFLAEPARRPAIVYAPSRKLAEELTARVNNTPGAPRLDSETWDGQAQSRMSASVYHAGLPPQQRESVQRDFLSGKTEVIVATIAFGMGIDKADVRTVIHAALPASVEAYYQEIGRAGRDGQPSRTVLLYSFADRRMHDFFLERDYPILTELQRVHQALTDTFQLPQTVAQQLKIDTETFARSAEKLAAHGAAQFDVAGLIRRADSGEGHRWQPAYARQVDFRRAQIDRMMHFAETQQCRMAALIRHFGDTADSHQPCGLCDFCAPAAAASQTLAEPTAEQHRDLRRILRALHTRPASIGKLHTELALTRERKHFDQLLDGLARAGLITLSSETFTNAEGNVVPFKKAVLTHEGREGKDSEPLGVLLPNSASSFNTLPRRKSSRVLHSSRSDEWESGPLTAAQETLEAALRAFRKAEAARTGKPAFIVFSDAALAALVRAAPCTIPQLLTVSGFGPDKAERYGAGITAIIRGEAPSPQRSSPPVRVQSAQPKPKASRPKSSQYRTAADEPSHLADSSTRSSAGARTFTRQSAPTPSTALTPTQQVLESRLRDWRKSESERRGLPQFFVLGTTTLRDIVLHHPRTLNDLKSINGIGPEKLGQLGPAILNICNAELRNA